MKTSEVARTCRAVCRARAEAWSCSFWRGSAPVLGGRFWSLLCICADPDRVAINRYANGVKRQMDVLDRRSPTNEYLAGHDIHDRRHGDRRGTAPLAKGRSYGAGEFYPCTSKKAEPGPIDAKSPG